MRQIIAATDFSPASINAVNFAADMATTIHANLLLVHVYSVPVSYEEIPIPLISLDELKKESEKKLEYLKSKLQLIIHKRVSITTAAVVGDTVDELEKLHKEKHPYAIVMGTKGKSAMKEITFGSTILTAIRHLTCPVFCIPPGKEYGKGIKKIGFACDLKEIKEKKTVQFIRNIVWDFDAQLHLLNVDFKDKHYSPDTPEQLFLLHEKIKDLKPQYHFICNPDIAEGIHEFVESNHIDLVIVVPKKHKLLDGIFNPGSSKKLIFQSHIPVMCVHQ